MYVCMYVHVLHTLFIGWDTVKLIFWFTGKKPFLPLVVPLIETDSSRIGGAMYKSEEILLSILLTMKKVLYTMGGASSISRCGTINIPSCNLEPLIRVYMVLVSCQAIYSIKWVGSWSQD